MGTYYYKSRQRDYPPYLAHHGVKGMKWGVRRYYNNDGSLNNRGLARQQKLAEQYKDYGDGKISINEMYRIYGEDSRRLGY